MALLGGAGPAVVAGLCAVAALGYAIYQVNISGPAWLYEPGPKTTLRDGSAEAASQLCR